MKAEEIRELASKSPQRQEKYVKKVYELINRDDLFDKSPDKLSNLRKGLMRDCLSYFKDKSDYYAQLFENLGIDPNSAEFNDLAKLAVPSDMLRGEGQKPFIIEGLDTNGEHFTSSGTTGKTPVRIYRSPVDLEVMMKANTDLFQYVYGDVLEQGEGTALFMAAPELRDRLYFIASVHLTLENKGLDLIYGMDMVEGKDPQKPWLKLEPNKSRIMKFLRSKNGPKLFFTAPAGVHAMNEKFDNMGLVNKIVYKLSTGSPPVDLKDGGVIVTGGGSKGATDLPPYDQIVDRSRANFKCRNKTGAYREVPFMDVLGMTETLTALIDNYGEMDKVPHPLSEVFLLDPNNMEIIEGEEKQGALGIFNPFVTSWLEVFYPGDIMNSHSSERYYGKEFVYQRRLTVEEGWDLQRACGGTLEEMMGKGN